jgi:hypothetical protein
MLHTINQSKPVSIHKIFIYLFFFAPEKKYPKKTGRTERSRFLNKKKKKAPLAHQYVYRLSQPPKPANMNLPPDGIGLWVSPWEREKMMSSRSW